MSKPHPHTGARKSRRKPYIPHEFQALLNQFTRDPHEKLELWWYSTVCLMIERSQVEFAGTHEQAGRTWMKLRLRDENEFDVVLPRLSREQETRLLDGVRAIVANRREQNRAP